MSARVDDAVLPLPERLIGWFAPALYACRPHVSVMGVDVTYSHEDGMGDRGVLCLLPATVSRVCHNDRAVAKGQLRPMVTDLHPLAEAEDLGQPLDCGTDVVIDQNGHHELRRCRRGCVVT